MKRSTSHTFDISKAQSKNYRSRNGGTASRGNYVVKKMGDNREICKRAGAHGGIAVMRFSDFVELARSAGVLK